MEDFDRHPFWFLSNIILLLVSQLGWSFPYLWKTYSKPPTRLYHIYAVYISYHFKQQLSHFIDLPTAEAPRSNGKRGDQTWEMAGFLCKESPGGSSKSMIWLDFIGILWDLIGNPWGFHTLVGNGKSHFYSWYVPLLSEHRNGTSLFDSWANQLYISMAIFNSYVNLWDAFFSSALRNDTQQGNIVHF